MGIVVKLTLFVSFLLAVLTTLAGFLINQQTSEVIVQSEARAFELVFRVIQRAIEEDLDYAELALDSQLSNPELRRLFQNRDRPSLLRYFMNFYPSIKERLSKIHFHLPDGRTFLRIHSPDHYDDPISERRPMLQKMHDQPQRLRGLEMGVHGLGLRVIKPVWSESGRYLGALEYSMEFDIGFLNRLKQSYEGEFYLRLLTQEPPGYLPITGTAPVDNCPTSREVLERIRGGERFWLTSCEASKAVGYFPLRYYSGEVGGYIKAEIDRGLLVRDILSSRERLSYLGLAMVAIVGLGSFWGLSVLLNPLKKAVAQAAAIRGGIGEVFFPESPKDEADTSDLSRIIREIETLVRDLKDRHRMLISIAEGFPGLVFFFSVHGELRWMNRLARETLKLKVPLPAQLGRELPETGFFAGEQERIRAAFEARSLVALCQETPDAENSVCWEHTAIPVVDSEGDIDSIIRISQDVTEKVKSQRQLEDWTRHLEEKVAQALEKQREQELRALLQSRLAAIGELAAGIAHEINQPLNSISFGLENTFERLRQGNLDEAYLEKKTRQLRHDIERIRRIIGHVRLFARDSGGTCDTSFCLADALRSALELFQVQYTTLGIAVDLQVPERPLHACGDAYQFEQVLINLLSNARDALEDATMDAGERGEADAYQPRLILRLREEGKFAQLEIQDNGPGIPEEIQNRILDPFFSTKAPGRGTGLGLSISYGILKSLGGQLSWESQPGRTMFRITLPLREES